MAVSQRQTANVAGLVGVGLAPMPVCAFMEQLVQA